MVTNVEDTAGVKVKRKKKRKKEEKKGRQIHYIIATYIFL